MPRHYYRTIRWWKYFDQWIDTYKVGQVSETTLGQWRRDARILKKMAPDLGISEITRMDVQQLINEYGKTHEITTVRDFLHYISAPLKDAVYDGYIKRDPTYKVRATSEVPQKKTRAMFLEPVEVRKLVAEFKKDPSIEADMFLIDLKTGLRFAELLGLTPADIDFQKMTIYVNKSLDYKDIPMKFGPTKNKYSNRVITVDWGTMLLIQKLIQGVPKDKPFLVEKYLAKDAKRFVPQRYSLKQRLKGKRIYNSSINRALTKYCKKAGVPRITIHNLRHTHASLLISHGVSIQSVAKRLGHGNTQTTERVYIHLLDDLEHKDNTKILGILSELGA